MPVRKKAVVVKAEDEGEDCCAVSTPAKGAAKARDSDSDFEELTPRRRSAAAAAAAAAVAGGAIGGKVTATAKGKSKGKRAAGLKEEEEEEEETEEEEEVETPKGKGKGKAAASRSPVSKKGGKAPSQKRKQVQSENEESSSGSDDDEWRPDGKLSEEDEDVEEEYRSRSSSDFETDPAVTRALERRQMRLSQGSSTRSGSEAGPTAEDTSASAKGKGKGKEKGKGEGKGKAKKTGAVKGEEKDNEEEEREEEEEDEDEAQAKPAKKRGKPEKAADRVNRLHPEIKSVWNDLKTMRTENAHVPQIVQPAKLVLKLLPFQIEGVSWMLQQEKTIFNGGILADEMGMGKTIQTISLALERRSTTKPSLIVCPAVALLQWHAEIQAHTVPGTFKVHVYHGQSRKRDVNELCKNEIVLTTYSTVESEWRRQQSGFKQKGKKVTESSVLHAVDWHRIVLDEAHFIKDRSSSTARAVFNLTGDFKWSLSGTPLQNRVGELYSLIKFLKADPYSYYFCTQCECKCLSWMFSDHRSCDSCGHKSMSHFCWWNREILKPIQKFGATGPGLDAYKRLHELLASIMLRRTKLDRGKELGLPPRIIYKRRDLFSEEEEDFYEALFSESKTKFESFVQAGTVLNNYAHIFELLMRMRQAVNHPWLVTHKTEGPKDVHVCGICHEEAEDPIISSCKHVFCREDMRLYISSSLAANTSCPVCFRNLSIDLTQPELEPKLPAQEAAKLRARSSIVRRLDMEKWRSSTKIEALLEEFHQLRSDRKSIKSIVFSQFTQFLDLLEWRLNKAGIRCVKLDGRMTPSDRAAMIDAFNTLPQISVFLISLKAGGLALNLTTASRVYIMDPWWNPAVEHQAMDRIHRLGQYRPIEVRRMIIENSIESRIDELQQKKHLLFESTVGGDDAALTRLSEDDLRFLFVM